MNLRVKVGNFNLPTPVICASGTFGYGEELKGLVNFKNIGAITTKTITPQARAGNPPPRIYETEYGVINSIGLENPGLEGFLEEKLPMLVKLPVKSIISVGGFSQEDYEEIVKRLEDKKIEALEINLSCPNIKMKKMFSQNKELTYNLVKSLRALTKKTLIIKITPEIDDIVEIAKASKEAGADALSLVNTFFALAINIETKKPYLGSIHGGYSSRAIKPLALYKIWQVYKSVDIPIIGGGGIENTNDAIEFFLAGATAISIGTINLVYPNRATDIVKGLKDYMKRKKISDINELRGGMLA
ncbi:MAG: dihydroorotate dehydrogenase [Candidatus Omnitrophica bacterium]|jgi:dihydroorotate dehydrogenase (NAD+) catalytic subunit|nr:dihydroorotate dehydrogenase [Candidatus Omnitrophota bacterium]